MNNSLPNKYIVFLTLYSVSAGIFASAFFATYAILSDETTDTNPTLYQFGYSEPYQDISPNDGKLVG